MSNSTSNNKMSVMQLTLLTALNMMGSGIIMLPTKLAEIGTFSILSWLVTATGSTAMAYAFAKCGMLSRRPGGMADTPNTPSANPGTSWRTTPTPCPSSSRTSPSP